MISALCILYSPSELADCDMMVMLDWSDVEIESAQCILT